MTLPTPLLVQSEAALAECCERCRHAGAIAVDTEFERTSTFFPILGLIQLCDGETVWLVDPLTIRDFSSLRNLLTDPDVVKVFHSCSEDMDVLRHHLNLVPAPVFDTQVAAAFLGYGYSRGYSALVEKVLDVALEKHETRSDWLQRPLSKSQLVYAAEDVHFLIQVYHRLVGELEATGREDWMAEEMAQLQAVAENPEPLENYYLRVKGAWRLPSLDLARLRAMTLWREREARQRDMPRNRVVPDKALLEMLRTGPRNVKGLFGIDGLRPGMVKRYGETLVSGGRPRRGRGGGFSAPAGQGGEKPAGGLPSGGGAAGPGTGYGAGVARPQEGVGGGGAFRPGGAARVAAQSRHRLAPRGTGQGAGELCRKPVSVKSTRACGRKRCTCSWTSATGSSGCPRPFCNALANRSWSRHWH